MSDYVDENKSLLILLTFNQWRQRILLFIGYNLGLLDIKAQRTELEQV